MLQLRQSAETEGPRERAADESGLADAAPLNVLTLSHRDIGLKALSSLPAGCAWTGDLHDSLSRLGIESVVIATCHRAEVYWRSRSSADNAEVERAFVRLARVDEGWLQDSARRLQGERAFRHLFRVACGLESVVLGEAEILGQIRSALEACDGAGSWLRAVFHAAMKAGRYARVETSIGAGGLSVASVAVQWLQQRLHLTESRILVVGAGETGQKVARHVRSIGATELVIANRTRSRAEALANALQARAVGLDGLREEIHRVDALVCAVKGGQTVVSMDVLRQRAHAQPGRPLLVVDLGMPGGVEPGDTPGVIRMDLSEVEGLTQTHRLSRAAETPKVEALIEREMKYLRVWARRRAVHPLVSDLRRKVEAIRREEMAQVMSQIGPTGPAPTHLENLSQRLIKRLLELPLGVIEEGDEALDPAVIRQVRRLFALDPSPRQ